jgi:hypothetical protein
MNNKLSAGFAEFWRSNRVLSGCSRVPFFSIAQAFLPSVFIPIIEYIGHVPIIPVMSRISPISAIRYDQGAATIFTANRYKRIIPKMILIIRSIMPTFFSPYLCG